MSACRSGLLKLCLAVAGTLLPLVFAGGAQATVNDPNGFQFLVPPGGIVVNENAGQAVITVFRSPLEASHSDGIGYITSGDGFNPATNSPYQCGPSICTATSDDFSTVKGWLSFAPGQTTATFTVPVSDEGVTSVPKTFLVSFYGQASPVGPVSSAPVTILYNDPAPAVQPGNPLGLPSARADGNPLAGASFFVDHQSEAALAAKQNGALNVIAGQPGTARFGFFSYGSSFVPTIGIAVSRYLARARSQEPGTVPLLATYAIVNGTRGNGDSPARVAAYENFINGFAQGIGSSRAVLFLEMDSIITMPGLNATGQATRLAELKYAVNTLSSQCPRLVVYLDSGAADALHANVAASYLNRAGISKIQGFFLNATHFDWTKKEISYGDQISRLTGGKHFVINTGENGQGPLQPHNIVTQGLEVLCNPVGRGLGPKPTANTGYPNVDMFAWTTNPGESGGQCHGAGELPGAPPTGQYWPAYAAMLVRNANFAVH